MFAVKPSQRELEHAEELRAQRVRYEMSEKTNKEQIEKMQTVSNCYSISVHL